MHDDTTVAALIGLMWGLVKIIEKGVNWAISKKKGHVASAIVQLDPQASAALVQILARVEKIEETVSVKDQDGIPLIYFPRSLEERIHDNFSEIKAELYRLRSNGVK